MAIKAQAQQTLIDITDGYSVVLTSEAYTFPGTTTAAKAGSCTTQVLAYQGGTQVACSVGTMTTPTGISVSKDTNATAPTLTVTATTSFTSAGEITIPVTITGTEVVINKKFSLSIAFTGETGSTGATGATGKGISSTSVTYQASSSGTTTPTGTWSSTIPTVSGSQYLWTRTIITYSDSTTSTAYSVGMMGATGAKGDTGATGATGKGVSSTAITYQASSSGTTAPTGTWSSSIPAVSASQYLWTRTIITYSDNNTSTIYSVGMMGATGATGEKGATGDPGADALVIAITSSGGFIFKNTSISTTLTAHVYRGGVELTSAQIAALGTIKWYKDGSSTALSTTGQTLTLNSGDVSHQANFIASLEG